MYMVCGFWLGLGVWSKAEKKYYLWLPVGKMHAFAVFTEIYLRPNGCSDTNFTAAVKCTNLKTKIQSEIIQIEIIEIQI